MVESDISQLRRRRGPLVIELNWAPTPQVDGPSLFAAPQDQLGMKLEAKKATVGFVVVDHADRPTEN